MAGGPGRAKAFRLGSLVERTLRNVEKANLPKPPTWFFRRNDARWFWRMQKALERNGYVLLRNPMREDGKWAFEDGSLDNVFVDVRGEPFLLNDTLKSIGVLHGFESEKSDVSH